MLRMDGTRPTVMPETTLSRVELCSNTRTAPRFLDAQDETTVRAFSTRPRRAAQPAPDLSWRPSYRMMKSRPLWARIFGRSLQGAGAIAALTATAFAAGLMAHWALTV